MIVDKIRIMAVGLADKSEILRRLPVEVFEASSAGDALKVLRGQVIEMLVSRWDLPDMPDGGFLDRYVRLGTGKPTAAFVDPARPEQETKARLMRVSLVLPEDTDEDLFYDEIMMLLGDRYGIEVFRREYEKLLAEQGPAAEVVSGCSL